MRDWAGLLPELLNLIFNRIDSVGDMVSMGCVCSTWRTFYRARIDSMGDIKLPWLMLAENQNNNEKGIRQFYSLTEKKIYNLELPELRGKMCIETKGWLLTISNDGEMSLVHPLTHGRIPLPHRDTFEYHKEPMQQMRHLHKFVHRAVLSSSPNSSEDYALMVIHGNLRRLGFWRVGNEAWTVIKYYNGPFLAIEYYRGKFYAINTKGEIWEYMMPQGSNDSNLILMWNIENIRRELLDYGTKIYIIGSAGHLLMVIRNLPYDYDSGSLAFDVYKYDLGRRPWPLTKMENLSTQAIFLGHSAAICIDTNAYPGISPNSIYFTDDIFELYVSNDKYPQGGGKDIGVYNLSDKSVTPHYGNQSLSSICPPIWTFLTFI